MELEIGYEGIIPLDATRLTRIGVPAEVARHSDWDQIGKSFTAVRGIGYVAWYPVATESANLSEGNSVFRNGREMEGARSASAAENQAELTPARARLQSCCAMAKQEAAIHRTDGRSIRKRQPSVRFNLWDETVPLFVIGALRRRWIEPPVNISYLPDHKPAAETYALAAQTGDSVRDRVVWRAERTSRGQSGGRWS